MATARCCAPIRCSALIAPRKATEAAGVLLSAEMADPTGYGRVIHDARGHVSAVVEQKAATREQLAIREANMGIYCYRAGPVLETRGRDAPDNPAREYYLTDMVEILNRAGHHVEALEIDDPREVLGINNRVELAEADRLFRERKRARTDAGRGDHREARDGDHRRGCEIGIDTVIEPFAQILGETTIGENCRIGACAIMRDSQLADEVEIGPFTLVDGSRLERGGACRPVRAPAHGEPSWRRVRTWATSWS